MGCTNQTCTVLFLCLFAFSFAEIKDDKGDEGEYDCRSAENLKRDRYVCNQMLFSSIQMYSQGCTHPYISYLFVHI